MNKASQDLQTFDSTFVVDEFGGSDRFTGVQFHFHTGSEHTVDGKRHDLEMHTVHLPKEVKGNIKYAAVGVFFSVNDHNAVLTPEQERVIDRFFESLNWNVTTSNPAVAEVPYGELMMMVDTDNRWVYKGSVTTPPCDTIVYWNVLRTVYPIKEKYFNQFKEQMKRGKLEQTGNYRNTVPIDLHDVHIITSEQQASSNPWVIIFLVGFLISLGFAIPLCISNKKLQASLETKETSRAEAYKEKDTDKA